jgi:adhesin transport system membrane fusion protein
MAPPRSALEEFRSPIHGVAPALTPPSATALLLWSGAAFLALFAAAALLDLDEVVTAPARIEPSSLVRHVQHYEGGTIRDVLVKEGAQVGEGDVLLRLVNSQGAQDLADRQARALALEARTVRLKADLASATAIAWPAAIDPETQRREAATHVERLGHRDQQLTVIRREVERRRKEITETETKVAGLAKAQAKGQQEMAIKKKAFEAGVVGSQDVLRLEREQLMLDTEIATARETVGRLRAQLHEAEAKLAEFDRGWRAGVLEDIGKAEAELSAVRATASVAGDRESRSEARSPVNGVVKMAAITSVGQVARPGDTLMDIVPADDTLVVEAKVAPQDIAQVREGLKASVRLTAYDQYRYGRLDGWVTMVGADALEDTRGTATTLYYRVLVRAERTALTDAKGNDHAIRPGMVGSASIVVGRKSILRMVFDPLLRHDLGGSLHPPRFLDDLAGLGRRLSGLLPR